MIKTRKKKVQKISKHKEPIGAKC